MYKRVLLYGSAVILGTLAAIAVTAVFTIMTIRGSGMEPTLYDGDKVLINKLAYAKSAAGETPADIPSVDDIVAFRSDVYGEEGEGSILVRRVAGAPGDVVEMDDMDGMAEIRLGSDEIFVLGDNRKTSMDSRNEAIGVLKIDDCVGKVVLKWRGLRH